MKARWRMWTEHMFLVQGCRMKWASTIAFWTLSYRQWVIFQVMIFINAVSFLCFIYGVFSGLKCCFFPFPLAWTQSLWHLRRFRDEFLRKAESGHVHVGDPCVVCALYEIFTALSDASTDMRREAVAPSSLRIALSNLYPESNFFQEVV